MFPVRRWSNKELGAAEGTAPRWRVEPRLNKAASSRRTPESLGVFDCVVLTERHTIERQLVRRLEKTFRRTRSAAESSSN
jgi:hypothetical protein